MKKFERSCYQLETTHHRPTKEFKKCWGSGSDYYELIPSTEPKLFRYPKGYGRNGDWGEIIKDGHRGICKGCGREYALVAKWSRYGHGAGIECDLVLPRHGVTQQRREGVGHEKI